MRLHIGQPVHTDATIAFLQAEVDRLTAALEVERGWWEALELFGIFHLTREARDQRLKALTAALEGQTK